MNTDRLPERVQNWLAHGGNQPQGMTHSEARRFSQALTRKPRMGESLAYLTSRFDSMTSYQKFMTFAMLLGATGMVLSLAGCDDIPDSDGDGIPDAMETDELPPPGVTEVVSTPEPPVVTAAVILPPETSLPLNTPEPSRVCDLDPQTELFAKGLSAGQTVPVLSEGGFAEVFGQNPEPTLKQQITNQVAFDAAKLALSGVGSRTVLVPNFVDPNDVVSGVNAYIGSNPPFAVYKWGQREEIEGDKILIALHAGANGWTTAPWDNPDIGRRPDGSAFIDGSLMTVADTAPTVDDNDDGDPSNDFGLWALPAQNQGQSHADVTIVDGCAPTIVRTDANGKVNAVLAPDANPTDINGVWIGNQSAEPDLPEFAEGTSQALIDKYKELVNAGFNVSLRADEIYFTDSSGAEHAMGKILELEGGKTMINIGKLDLMEWQIPVDSIGVNEGDKSLSYVDADGRVFSYVDGVWRVDSNDYYKKLIDSNAGTYWDFGSIDIGDQSDKIDIYPIYTGERGIINKQLGINGEVDIDVIKVVLPDPNNTEKIAIFYLPLQVLSDRYGQRTVNGTVIEDSVPWLSKITQTGIEYMLLDEFSSMLTKGKQIEVSVFLKIKQAFLNSCKKGEKCEWNMDLSLSQQENALFLEVLAGHEVQWPDKFVPAIHRLIIK